MLHRCNRWRTMKCLVIAAMVASAMLSLSSVAYAQAFNPLKRPGGNGLNPSPDAAPNGQDPIDAWNQHKEGKTVQAPQVRADKPTANPPSKDAGNGDSIFKRPKVPSRAPIARAAAAPDADVPADDSVVFPGESHLETQSWPLLQQFVSLLRTGEASDNLLPAVTTKKENLKTTLESAINEAFGSAPADAADEFTGTFKPHSSKLYKGLTLPPLQSGAFDNGVYLGGDDVDTTTTVPSLPFLLQSHVQQLYEEDAISSTQAKWIADDILEATKAFAAWIDEPPPPKPSAKAADSKPGSVGGGVQPIVQPAVGGGGRGGTVPVGLSPSSTAKPGAAATSSSDKGADAEDPETNRKLQAGLLAEVIAKYPCSNSTTDNIKRPFMLGDAYLSVGTAPILVVGSGSGHLSLRLADALSNHTVLSVSFTGREASGQTDADYVSPVDISAILKRRYGVWNAWSAEIPLYPSQNVPSGLVLEAAHQVGNDEIDPDFTKRPAVDALVDYLLARGAPEHEKACNCTQSFGCATPFTPGLIVLPDFDQLHGSELPHEFEASLGKLLSTSRFFVVPSELPNGFSVGSRASNFFSYWKDVEALVGASANSAGLVATIRQIGVPKMSNSKVQQAEPLLVVMLQTLSEVAIEDAILEDLSVSNAKKLDVLPGNVMCDSHLLRNSLAASLLQQWEPGTTPIKAKQSAFLSKLQRFDKQDFVVPEIAEATGIPLDVLMGLGLHKQDIADLVSQFLQLDAAGSKLASMSASDMVVVGSSLKVIARRTCTLPTPAAVPTPNATKAKKIIGKPVDYDDEPVAAPGKAGFAKKPSAAAVDTEEQDTQPAVAPAQKSMFAPAVPAKKPAAPAAQDQQTETNEPEDRSMFGRRQRPGDVAQRVNAEEEAEAGTVAADSRPKVGGRQVDTNKNKEGVQTEIGTNTAPAVKAPATGGKNTGIVPPNMQQRQGQGKTQVTVDEADTTGAAPPMVTEGAEAEAEPPRGVGLRGRYLLEVDTPSSLRGNNKGQPAQVVLNAALRTPQSWNELRPVPPEGMARSKFDSKRTVREEDGVLQQTVVEAENDDMDAWWKSLHGQLETEKPWSALVSGSSGVLLSTKLARGHPSSTVLTVHPADTPFRLRSRTLENVRHDAKVRAALSVNAHTYLVNLLGITNNFIASASLSTPRVKAAVLPFINSVPAFQYAFHTSADSVVADMVTEALDILRTYGSTSSTPDVVEAIQDIWADRLGSVLRLAASTFIHLPSLPHVFQALRLFSPPVWRGLDNDMDTLLPAALLGQSGCYICGVSASRTSTKPLPSPAPHTLSHSSVLDPFDLAEDEVQGDLQAGRGTGISEASAPSKFYVPQVNPYVTRIVAALATAYSTRVHSQGLPAADVAADFVGYQQMFESASIAAGLTDATASLHTDTSIEAQPRVFMRIDTVAKGAAVAVAPGALSVHSLLTFNADRPLKARLFRMFLSLPFTAIMRRAATAQSTRPDVFAPWSVVLRPDANPACQSRLWVSIGKDAYYSELCISEAAVRGTPPSMLDSDSLGMQRSAADEAHLLEKWAALASQLLPLEAATGGAVGKFSFVEHNSGLGSLSMLVARAFPNATVLSLEENELATNAHLAATLRGGVYNNLIARTRVDADLLKKIYDSPEFFRYQVFSGDFADILLRETSFERTENLVSTLVSLAATSFIEMPTSPHISLAFTMFTDSYPGLESVVASGHKYRASNVKLASMGRLNRGTVLMPNSRYAAESIARHVHEKNPYCRVLWVKEEQDCFAGVGSMESEYRNFGGVTPISTLTAKGRASTVFTQLQQRFAIEQHPRAPFKKAELRILTSLVRAPGGSVDAFKIVVAPIPAKVDIGRQIDDVTPASVPLTSVSLATAADDKNAVPSSPVLTTVTSGLVRVDIAQLTRHVNHHFQSDIDGHSRKYTLHVQSNITASAVLSSALSSHGFASMTDVNVAAAKSATVLHDWYEYLSAGNHPNHGFTTTGDANVVLTAAAAWDDYLASLKPDTVGPFPDVEKNLQRGMAMANERGSRNAVVTRGGRVSLFPGVVSIILTRDMDTAFIPYDSVHGITLITMLRLGLLAPLSLRAYHQFVALPLFQDMAPWNIVFVGGNLDYIDYDTKDHTYDKFVIKAYEVMEVLFNYKRTIEDFKRCGSKASNPYNFPYVSECVGASEFTGPCKDSAFPVPCGDGTCKSDYISCLRALSETSRQDEGVNMLRWAFKEYASALSASQDDEAPMDLTNALAPAKAPGKAADLTDQLFNIPKRTEPELGPKPKKAPAVKPIKGLKVADLPVTGYTALGSEAKAPVVKK